MIEWIIVIASGYAVGCIVAVALMSAVMFSKRGIKWMYHRSKTIMEAVMEEELKPNEEEEDEDAKLERAFELKAWRMED